MVVQQGAVPEAITAIREGFASGRAMATIWQSYARRFIAEAFAREGNYPEAHAAIRQALDGIDATGERMWQPEIHRIHDLVLREENKPVESEAAFSQALDRAR